MNDIIQLLKGISCILTLRALADKHTVFEWEPEMAFLINETIVECINKLEKIQSN